MAKKSASTRKAHNTQMRSQTAELPVGLFLGSLPDTNVFTLDKRYQYTSFSTAHAAAMKKIWGVKISIGMSMLASIGTQKDRAKAKKNFDSALKGKHLARIEQYGDPVKHERAYYEDRYGPIKNKSGKIIGIYVWVVDFSKHRKAETAIKHYSSLLSSSMESVNHGILVVDLNNRVVFSNQKFLELWRIPNQLRKNSDDRKTLSNVLKMIVDPIGFLNRVEELYKNPQEESTDLIVLKDGRIFTRYTRPHYLGKKIIGRVWSFRDSTRRMLQEKSLINWKNRYELIVASFGRVVYDYNLTTGSIHWSDKVKEVLGYTNDEMADVTVWENYIHPDDRANAIQLLEEAKKNLSRYDANYRFKTKANGYIWLKDVGFFTSDESGQATRMLGEMTDVTQQIQADREIRHLATFPLHSPEIVIEISPDGSLTYGNPAFYEAVRRLGLSDHRPFISEEIRSKPTEGKPWKHTDEVVVAGRTFNLKVFYLSEKELIRIYAFDLTDRLEIEKQKNDLELTYQTLFESATDAIMLAEADTGKIISANFTCSVLYGYSVPELLKLSILDLDVIVPGVHITYEERLIEIEKNQRQTFEILHRRKDGSLFPLEATASLFELSGKRVQLIFMRDITQRKKAEEEIKLQYRFIESLAAASPNAVYVYDIESQKYVYGNQHLAEAYGHPLHQLMVGGHSLIDAAIHPDDLLRVPGWIDLLRNAKDGEVIESRFRLKSKSGGWRTFQSREAVFVRNPNGSVKQYIGSSIDITTQVEAEEALRESEQRFRVLHEASFGGIAIHDMGIIEECNSGLSRLTGYTHDELIGMNGLHLIHADDRALTLQKIQTQDENPYDVRGLHKDGSIYALEIKGKTVPFRGKIMRVTEFRDITERVKAAENIKEQNTRLQSIAESLRFKNQQLDEFTQIVSHNLRAPAGNIVSLADFLATEKNEAEREKIMSLLKYSGASILTTLTELNEVLKIKQAKNIEKQFLTFNDVYYQACQMLNAQITATHALLSTDFKVSAIEYPNIYLESIFLNLISNALKYHDPKRQLNISCRTFLMDDKVCLEVTDTGLGINLERYGHQIFKMRKTFHHHPDSRGIGLFMIKNQVEAMGGKISVQSQEGVGSTFQIVF